MQSPRETIESMCFTREQDLPSSRYEFSATWLDSLAVEIERQRCEREAWRHHWKGRRAQMWGRKSGNEANGNDHTRKMEVKRGESY